MYGLTAAGESHTIRMNPLLRQGGIETENETVIRFLPQVWTSARTTKNLKNNLPVLQVVQYHPSYPNLFKELG
jgi:hypothetical protein